MGGSWLVSQPGSMILPVMKPRPTPGFEKIRGIFVREHGWFFVIASEAKQSMSRLPLYGLLRFARNDDQNLQR
jgi:hypothetical protein